jgi:hypothetical protein
MVLPPYHQPPWLKRLSPGSCSETGSRHTTRKGLEGFLDRASDIGARSDNGSCLKGARLEERRAVSWGCKWKTRRLAAACKRNSAFCEELKDPRHFFLSVGRARRSTDQAVHKLESRHDASLACLVVRFEGGWFSLMFDGAGKKVLNLIRSDFSPSLGQTVTHSRGVC